MDIVDNSDELWVYVEAPGFQPEEIRVRGDETTLLVSAERPTETEEGRKVVVQERAQQLERTIQLPAPVDIAGAELTYEDGVCKVMLPKAAAERFTELTFR
jgi:HSP20 family protein